MKHFLYLILVLSLSGCLGSKKTTENTSIKEKETITSTKKDSSNTNTINKKIEDIVEIPVPKSDTDNEDIDKIVNAKLRELLAKMNFSKTSGDNSYKLSYNEIKDLLEIGIVVGETKNSKEKVVSEQKEQTTDTEYISKYVKKIKGIPLIWFIIAGIVIFRKQIFSILAMIFPALRMTKFFGVVTSTRRTQKIESNLQEQNENLKQMFNELKNEIHDIKNPL